MPYIFPVQFFLRQVASFLVLLHTTLLRFGARAFTGPLCAAPSSACDSGFWTHANAPRWILHDPEPATLIASRSLTQIHTNTSSPVGEAPGASKFSVGYGDLRLAQGDAHVPAETLSDGT